MTKRYKEKIEENERLLKNEMELMERKNEELKRANEEAEEARREALAANAAKGRFLAQMSHEIRTPINAVLGMDTMILREAKDSKIKEYALDIQNAGQSLLALINDILDFSKIESGKMEIIPVEYDFSSLIHDISNMINTKVKSKKLNFIIHADEAIPSKMLGDDVRIRQILINLLNNAVKYTFEGNIELYIECQIEGRKVLLTFMVKDTGIGIKEQDIDKLFKEFERIEEKRNRNIEGTGLGINITTQLLYLMGSRLKVESVYGKGSSFSFVLEQQIVDSTPIGNLEERIREQSEEYAYASAYTSPHAKLLVVDDNVMNLKVFTNLLKPLKVRVDVADSGVSCLEMVKKEAYDLIFLDHMMPGLDGIETLIRMKEMKNNKSILSPVIALTANVITGAKEMYLAKGFDAFLPKPVNPEKLEQMILKLLPREMVCFDREEEAIEEVKLSDFKENNFTAGISKSSGSYNFPIELPYIEGIDWKCGLSHLGSEEMLLAIVKDFYKTMAVEAGQLDKFYEQCMIDKCVVKDYRIKVHSMKGVAKLIGALVLARVALILENAAREERFEVLKALHHSFIEEWMSYREKLSFLAECGEEEENNKKDLEKNEFKMYLRNMKQAIEEMDMDRMDEIMKTLEGYKYEEEIEIMIQQLGASVITMDTVMAEEISDTLLKS